MATKLHEVLAIENGLRQTQDHVVEEARETFGKRADHFVERHSALTMFQEKDRVLDSEEHKPMVTTVADKLDYLAGHIGRYLDVKMQREEGNQRAKGDIEIDGAVVATDVPTTMLLGLEAMLGDLRTMYLAIPTLSPGREWVLDTDAGKGVYLDRYADVKHRTQKTPMHKVLVDATKEHPAQIEKWFEDVPVGKITVTTRCGMMSPAEKSDLLERVDRLQRAVKRARMRSNSVEVTTQRLGRRLMGYIHTGTL